METDRKEPTLTGAEEEALHELRLGVEHLQRGYGDLLECHHEVGRGMDHLERARALFREAGHDGYADELRDELLPGGAVGDRWTYELVESFRDGLLATVVAFGERVDEDLADGVGHVAERRQQREWRERATGTGTGTNGQPEGSADSGR